MAFFDTYQVLGVATELMGITKDGEKAIEQMKANKYPDVINIDI